MSRLSFIFFSLLLVIASTSCGGGGAHSTSPVTQSSNTQDCSMYPAQGTSPYVLPYPVGKAYYVANTTGHPEDSHYAIDFLMPIGSAVTASRAGVVYEATENFYDTDHDLTQANRVLVDQGDQTMALYAHLTHDGALVNVGDHVVAGQVIGLSGNSGLSQGPHLHFGVLRCSVPATNGSMDCPSGISVSVPVVFRNTQTTPCGLQVGQTPMAEPYAGNP
jgi:murein DD-endopeptidase MepM/ murein hydrolase activator NlpD